MATPYNPLINTNSGFWNLNASISSQPIFPQDLFPEITKYLELEDILKSGQVSKSWNGAFSCDYIWVKFVISSNPFVKSHDMSTEVVSLQDTNKANNSALNTPSTMTTSNQQLPNLSNKQLFFRYNEQESLNIEVPLMKKLQMPLNI